MPEFSLLISFHCFSTGITWFTKRSATPDFIFEKVSHITSKTD